MKLFFISFILIIITFTSCEFDLGNPLTGGSPLPKAKFTRMVVVQRTDSTICTNAWLIDCRNRQDTLYTDLEGSIPVIKEHSANHDSIRFQCIVRIKNSPYTRHIWEGWMYLYKGHDYKEFYITFPNY